MKTILIVDDEAAARYGMKRALEGSCRVVEAGSAEEARAGIESARPDAILLDLIMPGEDGLTFLKRLREAGDDTPVLIVTALDTAKTAVEALHAGATDYIVKGFDIEELRRRVGNILKLAELGAENERLRRELVADGQFGRMIGSGAAMRRVFEMAERVAPTDTTVLILGESGTGKDLLAQEIHARSAREGKAFVAVNCAALPENLIESELFGYERGAFTGASQQRKGKFELAHGGTIFLDEIGDMNPVTQAKVLRALENRKIERLGGTFSVDVDVRVISATHKDLAAEISAGRFREDLYYRLRVVTLELPALREHKDDIALLAAKFLEQLGERHGRGDAGGASKPARLSGEAMELLRRYEWPGNVRELRNALERAVVMCEGGEIRGADLPEEIRSGFGAMGGRRGGQGAREDGASAFLSEGDFREAKRKFEIAYLKRKLEENKWNVSQTAAEVGLHRQSLQEKLRELGIQRPGK
ncbi:MAG TPA: sigma-54 dependent transcriptional regulator [Candidatus Acidoferrales bacterium]|nr:sigma-54 dependent transcriptional regulator [Candidatus Acidoferrales bacterium]